MEPNFAGRIPEWPRFDASDDRNLLDVLHSRKWWRGNGVVGDNFEVAFAELLGVSHVRAVANGTLALELALAAVGVEPGDEVIVPACTFISTASAVLRLGAWPIPVDVERDTLNIDVDAVEQAITSRTTCIIPVHMAGHAARMPALMDIAWRRGITVIEDAAHAHGARAFGAAVGAIGTASIFSFQAGKLMTCGEGGVVATSDPEVAERTFALHSCGRPKGDTNYVHQMPSTNMRLTEFQSVLLQGQLTRLMDQCAQRERMGPFFEDQLRHIGFEPLARRSYVEVHSRYMTMAWFRTDEFGGRDAGTLALELRAMGIPAYRCFPEIHRTGMFTTQMLHKTERSNRPAPVYGEIHTPVSARAACEVVWFHHALLLGDEDLLADIADAVGSLRRMTRPLVAVSKAISTKTT